MFSKPWEIPCIKPVSFPYLLPVTHTEAHDSSKLTTPFGQFLKPMFFISSAKNKI